MQRVETAAADDDEAALPLFGKVQDRLRRAAGAMVRFIDDCVRDEPLCPLQDLLGFGPDGTCHTFRQPRYLVRIRTAIEKTVLYLGALGRLSKVNPGSCR